MPVDPLKSAKTEELTPAHNIPVTQKKEETSNHLTIDPADIKLQKHKTEKVQLKEIQEIKEQNPEI